jgi:hypothetical protein
MKKFGITMLVYALIISVGFMFSTKASTTTCADCHPSIAIFDGQEQIFLTKSGFGLSGTATVSCSGAYGLCDYFGIITVYDSNNINVLQNTTYYTNWCIGGGGVRNSLNISSLQPGNYEANFDVYEGNVNTQNPNLIGSASVTFTR